MNKKTKIIGVIIIFLILIGGLVFLIFYLQNKSFTYKSSKFPIEKLLIPKKEDTEELVIAVCNENVDWVDNYSKNFKLITVYNKCGRVLKFKSSNIKVIETPNIGTCDHAYLSYIIDRYDTLPDFIEFTKGWVKPTKEYHNCLPCKEDESEYKRIMNFKLDNYGFSHKSNMKMNNKFKWYKSGYKNMNHWIKNQDFLNEELYKKNTCNLIYGGHFGATKEQIIKTPKKVWEALRAQQKYPREEIDHFIERTWRPLLCKPKYKLVVVAIFKNKALAMREWLNHYVREGVEHFYMIDNGSTDNWQSEVKGFPVTIYWDPEKNKQSEHYNNYFLEEVKRNSEWVMVVDLDEFMYSRKSYKTIPEYLDSLDNNINKIEVRGKMFSSNGHIKQPKSIIKGFTKRLKNKFTMVNSIYRSSVLTKLNIHTHNLNGKASNYYPESGSEISKNIILLPNIINEEELNKAPLHLNHYAIQSGEWFRDIKMTRGDVAYSTINNVRNEKYFKQYDWNYLEDKELAVKSDLSCLNNSYIYKNIDTNKTEFALFASIFGNYRNEEKNIDKVLQPFTKFDVDRFLFTDSTTIGNVSGWTVVHVPTYGKYVNGIPESRINTKRIKFTGHPVLIPYRYHIHVDTSHTALTMLDKFMTNGLMKYVKCHPSKALFVRNHPDRTTVQEEINILKNMPLLQPRSPLDKWENYIKKMYKQLNRVPLVETNVWVLDTKHTLFRRQWASIYETLFKWGLWRDQLVNAYALINMQDKVEHISLNKKMVCP